MAVRHFIQSAALLLLAFCLFQAAAAQPQQKKNDCGKPPQWIPPPKLPKEERKKQPEVKLRGNVAIEINEAGDVISAKAVDPASGGQADQLAALAKSMKFKPRPGCRVYKTTVSYVLGMS